MLASSSQRPPAKTQPSAKTARQRPEGSEKQTWSSRRFGSSSRASLEVRDHHPLNPTGTCAVSRMALILLEAFSHINAVVVADMHLGLSPPEPTPAIPSERAALLPDAAELPAQRSADSRHGPGSCSTKALYGAMQRARATWLACSTTTKPALVPASASPARQIGGTAAYPKH